MAERRLRIGAWVRVSSMGQVVAESPETHIEGAEEWAEDHGADIVTWFRLDSITGSESLDHTEARRMVHLAKTGQIDGVLFTSLTRFGRDMVKLVEMQRELERYGVRILSIQENIDTSTVAGLDQFYNLARAAEIEVKRLAERVRRGLAMRRRRGEVTARAPYGYRKEGKRLVVDAVEGPIRASMYELYLRHRRIKTVARELNDAGHRTREGGLWSSKAVRRLLRDTTAIGRYVCNRYGRKGELKDPSQWVEMSCAALVSVEAFERVQRLMSENERNQPLTKPKTAFAGLLRCHCGRAMRFRKFKPETRSHARYRCPGCGNGIRYADLDQALGQIVVGFTLDDLPASARWAASPDDRWQRLSALDGEIAGVERERANLIRLATQSASLSPADFDAQHAPMVERLAQLEQARQTLKNELAVEADLRDDSARSTAVLSQVGWDELTPGEKAEVLRAFVHHITLTSTTIECQPRALPPRVVVAENLLTGGASPGRTAPYAQNFRLITQRPDLRRKQTASGSWGHHLRAVRLARGLTGKSVAAFIGVKGSVLAGWELRGGEPWPTYVPRIVEFLGFVPWNKTPYQPTFGRALAMARELRGLFQRELAAAVGVSVFSLNRIERDQRTAEGRVAKALERFVDMPLRAALQALWLALAGSLLTALRAWGQGRGMAFA